jgi:hypothetical protein
MHRREPSAEEKLPDTEGALYRDDLWGSGASFGDAGALEPPLDIPPLTRADPRRRRDLRGPRKRIEEYLERRRLEEALQEKLEDSVFRD